MKNPNPECTQECRFSFGPEMRTAMAWERIYDKEGNQINTDPNTATGAVDCHTCKKHWSYISARGKTTFFEFDGPK
jgi:hypothetical protein